jgi:hypothetical protein
MLDLPEAVRAGQARFQYPATFVLFSKRSPETRGEPRSGVASGQAVCFRGQSCSQLVTLSDPIMPILDHLAGLLVHRDALQLHQGNRKGPAFPGD